MLIVIGALTMRNGGAGVLAIGVVLTVVGGSLSQIRKQPSQPTSYGLPKRALGRDGVRLPPIPFTPLAGRAVMTGTFCSSCGTQGRSGDACCRRCGAGQASLVVQPFQECHCPSCGQTHSAPMEQFCRRCGKANA